jgi:hypothetical protein
MNMLGFLKSGSALIATWDDAYVFPEIQSVKVEAQSHQQELRTTFELRRSARILHLMPLGQGDWNTVAAAYRRYVEKKGLAITLEEKISRDPHVELMIGASNAKLWTSQASRYVKARVLPLAAPATTSIGPPGAVATASCSSLRSAAKSTFSAADLDFRVNFLVILANQKLSREVHSRPVKV